MVSTEQTVEAPRNTARNHLGHAAAFGLFLLFTLGMLWPYPRNAATYLRDLGDPLEYAWVLGYSADRLPTDPLHLYDGNIFYPFEKSLAYSDSTLASSLMALPVVALTDNPVLASNLLTLLSFILAGFGTYLLVFDLTKSRAAGLLAGLVFAFNPYRMDHLSQIPNAAAHWMPLVFWSLNRLIDRKSAKWAVWFAVFLILQYLSSFYYAYVISIALAAYLPCLVLWRPRHVLQRRVALPLGVAVAVSVVVLVVTSLPYFEVSRIYEMKRTISDAEFYSARPLNYLSVRAENWLWGHVDRMVRWGDGERYLFPGLLAIVLACVGMVVGKPRHRGVAFAVVGVAAFLISLGPSLFLSGQGTSVSLPFPMPYRVLYDLLPGFQSIRVPSRFAVAVMLAVSVLAGIGTSHLLAWLNRLTKQPVGLLNVGNVAAVVLAAAMLAEYWSAPIPMAAVSTGDSIPEVYKWLRDQPSKAALVELPIDNTYRQALYAYYSTYHHWSIVNGWRSFLPPGYAEMATVLQGFPSDRSLDLLSRLNVKYVVLHGGSLSEGDLALRQQRLRERADVRLVQQFGSDYVYELTRPLGAPLSIQIIADSPSVASAGGEYPVGLLLGGEERLLALPVAAQSVPVSADWLSEDGRQIHDRLTLDPTSLILSVCSPRRFVLSAPPLPGVYQLTLTVDLPGMVATLSPNVRQVVVRGDGATSVAKRPVTIQAVDIQMPFKVTTVADGFPLQITWRTPDGSGARGKVFVNVYDDQYRYWSNGNAPAYSAQPSEQVWVAGDAVDLQTVWLKPGTHPGYYWVEFGVNDPTTGQRLKFLDEQGNTVDKIAVGRLRVTKGEVNSVDTVAPQHPVLARLSDRIRLLGWTQLSGRPKPGDTLRLRLHWQSTGNAPANYSVFVHLYDSAGKLLSQHDGAPGDGAWPTLLWQTDDVIEDDVDLAIPGTLPPGKYTLAVGVYDPETGRRLVVSEGPDMGDSRVPLGQLSVGP